MPLQEIDLQRNFQDLKMEAYAGISQKRNSKAWILMLESAPKLLGRNQGELLLAVNTGMRLLDDIADGDRLPPPGVSRIEHLLDKQAFILNPGKPRDDLDHLFEYCYLLADRIGIEIHEELNAFFEYFLFDAQRLGTGNIFSRDELDQAYDSCDITGTIRGSLKLFGDDPNKAPLLLPLGRAVRKFYSLRDYDADIAAGFVNIPAESMAIHGIRAEDLTDRYCPPIKNWFIEESIAGMELLEQHNAIVGKGNFRLLGRLTLPFAYERPARAYFESVLKGDK